MPNFAVTGLGRIQDQQDYVCLSSHVKKKKNKTQRHTQNNKKKTVILSSSNLYLEAGKKPPIEQH